MSWYKKVVADLAEIPNFLSHYENELLSAKYDLSMKGQRLEEFGAVLPGIMEYRFNQLQEIEAVLEFVNIHLKKTRSEKFKLYFEKYNKILSSRDAEKYSEAEQDVIDAALLVNDVALLRNQYLGVIKGIEQKGWMIGHIIKLRVAGLDDAQL